MIRSAIIGYGKVAHLHAQALKESALASLIAVCGRNPDKTNDFAKQYGIKAYTSLEQMIITEKIQAIIICTPHPAHAEAAILAAELGVHVLVEKPMAVSLSDCDLMIAAAEKSSVKLGVISQRRFYRASQKVHQTIVSGAIGKPILATVTMLGWRGQSYYEADPWRGSWSAEGGGVLVNQAPHQLDLLLWYMGAIAEVSGFWANLNHPYIEVEDTAVAIIRFKNGGLGNIVLSNSQNPGLYGNVHVHGANGASVGVQTETGSMFIAGLSEIAEAAKLDIWTIANEEQIPADLFAEDKQLFERIDPKVYYIALQIEDFMQSILEDREPLVTAYDGRAVVELFTAIYRSQQSQTIIHFPLES
jgi:UDP-N-acetyl-2-amino-2-deoxyglucuronate dehydrogenase